MSSSASFEVEINTEYRTAVRFPAWMILSVFSAVALAALAARIKSDERGSDAKWAMAVASISMCVGLLATAAYLFIRGIFVGQIPEAIMVRSRGQHAWSGLAAFSRPGSFCHAAFCSVFVCVSLKIPYPSRFILFPFSSCHRSPQCWPFGALDCRPL